MIEQKKQRILFIDLMRAFAVFMMVQGHTIDSFLSPVYKTPDSNLFYIWNYIRGFTAPIFMFSAGVAFTYLFRLNGLKFSENPRAKKGFKRFFLLLTLAYLLRYPTYKIFDYSDVTSAQWGIFFTVDTLHLIAFGLLFIMLFIYISEKLKIDDIPFLIFGAALFVILQIFFEPVQWTNYVHPFFAGYLYSGSGSFFPLFPWVGYLLVGGALGSKIARNPDKVKKPKFGLSLILIAVSVFVFGKSLEQIKFYMDWGEPLWVNAIYWFCLRISIVLSLNGVMSLIAHKLDNIPAVIKLFGRYSLIIYVVHIVALYGDSWISGFDSSYYQQFAVLPTLLITAVMMSLMGMMVLAIDYIKVRTRKFLAGRSYSNFIFGLLENEKI